jgi:hypothetical protein
MRTARPQAAAKIFPPANSASTVQAIIHMMLQPGLVVVDPVTLM